MQLYLKLTQFHADLTQLQLAVVQSGLSIVQLHLSVMQLDLALMQLRLTIAQLVLALMQLNLYVMQLGQSVVQSCPVLGKSPLSLPLAETSPLREEMGCSQYVIQQRNNYFTVCELVCFYSAGGSWGWSPPLLPRSMMIRAL